MTNLKIAQIVARQLLAESRRLGVVTGDPRVRVAHRTDLEGAEREVADIVHALLASGIVADVEPDAPAKE